MSSKAIVATFRVLLIEASPQQAILLEGRIRQRQIAAGYSDEAIEIVQATTLAKAAFVLRHDKTFDVIYVDFDGIAPITQQGSVVSKLRHLTTSPIKVVARDIEPLKELADPRTTIVDKTSISQIDSSLQLIIEQMVAKAHHAENPGNMDAAIARLEVETQNIWRELMETKEELRAQLGELRTGIQSVQDQTILRVQDLPVKVNSVETKILLLEGRIDTMADRIKMTRDVIKVLKAIAAIYKFARKHWALIGGSALIPAAIALWELLNN